MKLCDFQLGKFCTLPINHPGKHEMEDDALLPAITAVLDAAEALVRAEEFGGGDFQTAAKAFRESVHAYRRARAGGGA